MKLRHYYVLVFCLLMLAIGQARIHTRLHVVECKLTDSITDADGTREWDGHTHRGGRILSKVTSLASTAN